MKEMSTGSREKLEDTDREETSTRTLSEPVTYTIEDIY